MEWHEGINLITPYIVHISTPQGSGTGWLVSSSAATDLVAVATAAHVIDYSHYWEAPIRVLHPPSGKTALLRAHERAIHADASVDSAAMVFRRENLPGLPTAPLPLIETGYGLKAGVEVGWLGFPAVHPSAAYFFTGHISLFDPDRHRYLVDGVAINGVSGGPTFRMLHNGIEIAGLVTAYVANRATGEALPGLAVVQDVSQFYDITQRFRSMDEAQSSQTPPQETTEAQRTHEEPRAAELNPE